MLLSLGFNVSRNIIMYDILYMISCGSRFTCVHVTTCMYNVVLGCLISLCQELSAQRSTLAPRICSVRYTVSVYVYLSFKLLVFVLVQFLSFTFTESKYNVHVIYCKSRNV